MADNKDQNNEIGKDDMAVGAGGAATGAGAGLLAAGGIGKAAGLVIGGSGCKLYLPIAVVAVPAVAVGAAAFVGWESH